GGPVPRIPPSRLPIRNGEEPAWAEDGARDAVGSSPYGCADRRLRCDGGRADPDLVPGHVGGVHRSGCGGCQHLHRGHDRVDDQLVLTIKTIDVTTPGVPCDNFDGTTTLYTGDLDSTAGKLVGDNTQGSQAGDRVLNAAAGETLCFRASLPAATGNAYQGAAS